ncbi:MAG: dihydroorotate dehydrogenase electron transfer subunit [bacterium]|nr:dihydroorotate dehydrogenase electron transfer subunit [bacterium]
MIFQDSYEVVRNREVADGYFKMTLNADSIAASCRPGQFINLKVNDGMEPLLRKPFGIYDVNGSHISILYRVKGRGTALLSRYRQGDQINILGPLGNGVYVEPEDKKTAVIAGGVGLAALGLIAKGMPGNFDLFFGVRNEREIIEQEKWQALANSVYISSDDGSAGEKGFITDLFARQVDYYDRIYCCGPEIMMKKIYDLCSNKAKTYFLLEEYMACGTGICMGCVCETRDGYQRVCKEGPVFSGEQIKW